MEVVFDPIFVTALFVALAAAAAAIILMGRRALARQLRQNGELASHTRVVHEHCSQPILIFDSKGLIRNLNTAAEGLLGYENHELSGQNVLRVLPNVMSAVETAGGEIEVRRKDGSRPHVRFHAARSAGGRNDVYLFFEPLSANGDFGYTEANGKVRARELERVVGRIANQFEDLLTIANGYSELAMQETPASGPLRDALKEIAAASEQAASIARSLSMFSGNHILPVEAVDLNPLIRNVEPALRRSIQHPIQFALHEPGPVALANADCLRQIVSVLCESAGHRMRADDVLTIRTSPLSVPAGRNGGNGQLNGKSYSILSISDSGTALDRETLDRLFEPMFLDDVRVGVDLSPIYGAVRRLGGDIETSSKPGSGTSFRIILPAAPPDTGAKTPDLRVEAPGQKI